MTPAEAAKVLHEMGGDTGVALVTFTHVASHSPYINANQSGVTFDDHLTRDEVLALATWFEHTDAVVAAFDAIAVKP